MPTHPTSPRSVRRHRWDPRKLEPCVPHVPPDPGDVVAFVVRSASADFANLATWHFDRPVNRDLLTAALPAFGVGGAAAVDWGAATFDGLAVSFTYDDAVPADAPWTLDPALLPPGTFDVVPNPQAGTVQEP